MIEKIFIDTSAFYSLATPFDYFHKNAMGYLEIMENKLEMKNIILISTDYIICETLNLLNIRQGHQQAIDFLESMENSPHFHIESISEIIKDEAKKIFKKYKYQRFSFTDCTSFAFMKKYNIKKAFTYDKHFKIMGFELVK